MIVFPFTPSKGLKQQPYLNTATFNSGHDKSPEFDYPYLWDYIGIHDIYWLGFVQRIHPPNFTPVGVIPVKILHLKSQNPTGFC